MAKRSKAPVVDPREEAMNAFLSSVQFVGWNTSGTSDKIWGYLRIPSTNDIVTFWGARRGPWTFKRLGSYSGGGASCYSKVEEKRGKGYEETTVQSLGIQEGLYEGYGRAIIVGKFHGA